MLRRDLGAAHCRLERLPAAGRAVPPFAAARFDDDGPTNPGGPGHRLVPDGLE